MNYNTQLCNTAWGKVFVALTSIFSFETKTVLGRTKTFGALAKEWLMKCKTSFLPPNEKKCSRYYKCN